MCLVDQLVAKCESFFSLRQILEKSPRMALSQYVFDAGLDGFNCVMSGNLDELENIKVVFFN